ncbi:FeoA family protein [Sphingopyxis sp. MWB1]|uniref:FeoA family protein n=1 Tax=Sphingopyxis sp. MWB1 TaxID=1537715 RepID=UPI00068AD8A4|nr:FeoA family protein [Sphingopyxis sp. MWB1]
MNDSLDSAALGLPVRISHIAWDHLSPGEGRRLREFGLMEGVEVTPLHRGSLFSRDPLALAVGRMKVVIRAAQAAKIEVEAAVAAA